MDTKERIKNIEKSEYFSRANLHAHSRYSDGKLGFNELLEQAKSLGLKHFSICDHNTLRGYLETGSKEDFLIPAVEFDCFYFPTLVHIIGYGIDVNNLGLQKKCFNSQRTIVRVLKSRHPKHVIKAIHQAGGIAVLAHPCCCWVACLDKFIKELKGYGLDGVEVYYPYNRHRGIIKFHSRQAPLRIAQKYDLILTGGTDEHGSLVK